MVRLKFCLGSGPGDREAAAWRAGKRPCRSCTSLSSWVRTSRSGAPSASASGTWSGGPRTDTLLPKPLGRFHRLCPGRSTPTLSARPAAAARRSRPQAEAGELDTPLRAGRRLPAGPERAAPRSAELPSVLIRVGARASRPTPSPPMDEARPGRRSGHLRTTIYAGIIGGPSAPMKALACTQEVQ